ncbi:dihydrofolate reductase family protein [Kribbella sp. HUAS MG21]|uniref:Dihydrofolate reductase family protein n=1 Tax=Kribbella sp. HUAS MG21 TaxID=3160966 RepID=A0AAU7T7U1_9ACTN
MRNLILTTYISLDGVIENPQNWSMRYFSEDAGQLATEILTGADSLLQGRATYEGFAGNWSEPGADAFSKHMYGMRKYVVSSTLTEATWNNSELLSGDLVEAVTALKAEDGGDILSYGFGSVAHTLLAAGLVDTLYLWVHPVIVGAAAGPEDLAWNAKIPESHFDTKDVRTLTSGVTVLTLTRTS